MVTSFKQYSLMPNYGLEVNLEVTAINPDGSFDWLATIGMRRTSPPIANYGGSASFTFEVGTSGGGGSSWEPSTSTLSYDLSERYQELYSISASRGNPSQNGDNVLYVKVTQTGAAPGNPVGMATVTAELPFPDADPVTQPSISPPTFTAGDAITINLPRKNPNYTHDLAYRVGGSDPVPIATGAGDSYALTTSAASILPLMPGSDQASFTVTSVTRDGSTIVGSASHAATVLAPASAVPTVTSLLASDANEAVATTVGAYVQGLSILRVDGITASSSTGAAIAERRLSIGGQDLRIGESRALLSSGTVPYTARAWDSRGREGSLSGSINVLPYTGPELGLPLPSETGSHAYRSTSAGVYDPEGAYLTVSYQASVASLMNSTQRNTLQLKIYTKPIDGTTWTLRNTVTPPSSVTGGRIATTNRTQVVSGGATYSPDESFLVRIEIIDKFNTLVVEETVATAWVTVDLNGPGVGVGKMHTRGAMDVARDAYFDGLFHNDWNITDADTAVFGGSYVAQNPGTSNLPSALPTDSYYRIVTTRSPLSVIAGVDAVVQYIYAFFDPREPLFVRTGSSAKSSTVVAWDGPWAAMGPAPSSPPQTVRQKQVNQNFTTGSWTAITWPTEMSREGIVYNSNGSVTIVTPGVYMISCQLAFNGSNTTGQRTIRIRINGTQAFMSAQLRGTGGSSYPDVPTITTAVSLVAGDIVFVDGFQSSGGTIGVDTEAGKSFFSIIRM